jgi:biopolymer transport protein ExbB
MAAALAKTPDKPAMEAAAAETLYAEETRLSVWVNYLNVCAQIAPMLGLFGTVVGMIESFNLLAAGKAEPSDLANGIGVAMITTAGGLIVAIPAMAAYFWFRGQLTTIFTDMQKKCSQLLDLACMPPGQESFPAENTDEEDLPFETQSAVR